jgi:hypothetical protein
MAGGTLYPLASKYARLAVHFWASVVNAPCASPQTASGFQTS